MGQATSTPAPPPKFYKPKQWNEVHISDETKEEWELGRNVTGLTCIWCCAGAAFNAPCVVGQVAQSLPADNGCVARRQLSCVHACNRPGRHR